MDNNTIMGMKVHKFIKYLPFYALSVLPMKVLYVFSDGIFGLLYYAVRYRRAVVFENLSKAFPERTESEIETISKRFYRHFCDVVFESLKSLTIGKKAAKRRLTLENPEIIEGFLKADRSILLYTAHQGNWEWLIYLPLMLPYRSNTFYRPLSSPYFNGLLLLIRERFGVHCVEESKGYRTILEQRYNPNPVMNCVIGDQSPRRKSAIHWCDFFDRETAFFLGADAISKKTDSAVLFPKFKKTARGSYQLFFDIIEEFPSRSNGFEIVENYALHLEKTIMEAPEMWLWSHRRWKLSQS